MSTANTVAGAYSLTIGQNGAITGMTVANSVSTLSARINSVFSTSGVHATGAVKQKPVELTVADVDPEHPDRLTIIVKNAPHALFDEMAEWLSKEAEGYPRRPFYDAEINNTLLSPWISHCGSTHFVNFDRATQENLAVYFRMRWS